MAKATTVGAVGVDLKLNDSNYDKQLNNKLKSSENAFSGTFKKIGGFIAGAFAVKQVANFTKECVSSASKVQSAFTGLNSIVQGTGNSFSKAQDFIKKYTADGLVSIEETATAYKNLLSRGYDSSQIEDVLSRLKDSAAFGRQASYDLGEAVVTATEGLKNENSILVDNAGVTKNVAKMWEDWAKAHGTTTSAMTQAQKIQAEYNGIMEETKFQVGDASAYTKTFSGQIQQLKFNFNQMTVAIGKVVTPIAQLFIPIINSAINAVTRLFEKIQVVMGIFDLKMPDVVSKTSNSIAGIGTSAKNSAKDAVASAKKINKAFAGVDEINVLKTKDYSSGGSGSPATDVSTSGGTSIGVSEATDGTITSAVSGTVDKIRKILEPLKNISFEPLVNSFDNLKKALEPFKDRLAYGLERLYFDILVPIAKYTIEDLIPSFLNLTAGALEYVGGVIDFTRPYFEWYWDHFLEPVAKWTGGVIVDILNKMGDKLSKLGKILSDIAPTYDKITKKMGFSKMRDKIFSFFDELPKKLGKKLGEISGKVAKALFVDIPNNVNKFITEIFPEKWSKFTDWLSNIDLLEIGKNIMKGLWNGICDIGDWITKKWDEFKESFINGFKDAFGIHSPSTVFAELGRYLIEGLWKGILSLKDWFSEKWNIVKSWFSDIVPKVKTKFETTKQNVATWYNNIKDWWGEKRLSIKNKFDTTKTNVSNWWKDVTNWWGTKTLEIKTKISEVKGSVKGFTNEIITKLNSKLPNWLPKIPMLAQGGYFKKNDPQLAIVGDNKREPEITTPESKIYEQAKKAIDDSKISNDAKEMRIILEVRYEDGRKIIKKINQTQIEEGEVLLLV